MTFGTAFVLRTRHKQTLPATRKVRTMFFKAKKNSRKTTRQTLSTEQLEPKAMFNATAFDTQICFEDRLGSSDMDVNDVVLQVKDVALDVGPVNQAGYSCESVGTCSDPIWTNGGASTLRVGADSIWTTGGPSTLRVSVTAADTATSLRSENRFVFEMPNNDNGISLHASANPHAGPEGFMKLGDIKGEFQLTQPLARSAGSGGSTPLRSENRFVFEAPKNDGLLVPAGYDFASFGLEANERVGGVGKGTFTTGAGGDSIVHPQYNVGEDGRMIVHPQYNVGEDGRMIVHPQYNVGEDGRMIVHPQYNVGGSASPGGDNIFMPMPEPDISIRVGGKGNGYAEAVGLDSSTLDTSSNVQLPAENVSLYDHVQTPRSQAFARMGR